MTTTPAGWYPDPENATQMRWWDGAQWTEQRSAPAVSSSAAAYSAAAAELKAPEGTSWNTVWIWLVVVLPFLPVLPLLAVDWSSMLDLSAGSGAESTLRMVTDPGYLLSTFGGFLAYGLGIWFAILDWRELVRRSVPRPFHWAWNFITPVYAIGRSVIVQRRTGSGISPMWVSIVLLVLSYAIAIALSVMIISEVVTQITLTPGVISG